MFATDCVNKTDEPWTKIDLFCSPFTMFLISFENVYLYFFLSQTVSLCQFPILEKWENQSVRLSGALCCMYVNVIYRGVVGDKYLHPKGSHTF